MMPTTGGWLGGLTRGVGPGPRPPTAAAQAPRAPTSQKRKTARKRPLPAARVVSVSEAAAILSVSMKSVYRKIKSGTLPATKFGSDYRIPKTAIERYIAEHP